MTNQRSLGTTKCLSSLISTRRLSLAAVKIDKTVLKELRSSTGFPFIKIKDALIKNENDPVKATHWLHEQAKAENWQKAQKLSTRNTSQGLVGLYQGPCGGSVGISTLLCETDFVARNAIFMKMIYKMSQSVCASERMELSAENVGSLTSGDKSISDHVMLTVGSLGENIQPGPAYSCTAAGNQCIGTYVHGAVPSEFEDFTMGSHVAVVLFEGVVEQLLATQIAQHVLGMNPRCVSRIPAHEEITDEECLVNQPLMHDASKTVGQVAEEKGFKILHFKRMTFLKPEEE